MNATFWDKRAKKYDEAIQKHDAPYDKSIVRTKSLLNDSDVVLDFGCASGEFAVDIASHIQMVHGIDTSRDMIELANEKARDRQVDNVVFDRLDVFDNRLVNHSFSAIIAFDIIHLVDDASKVLARQYDLLEVGGLLISQTPCLGERGRFFKLLIGLAQKLRVAPYIRSLTIVELEMLVSSGGFNIIESDIWDDKNAVHWIVARKS